MKTKSIYLMLTTVILSSALFFSSFSKNDVNAQSNNGIKTNSIPAYYDGKLFTIIFVELPTQAEMSLIAHNSSRNFIYRCDIFPNFTSVLDAIPGDGMNALWQEVQITSFNTIPPQQFLSDNDVLAAAASGAITLATTNEVYTCPVVGKKPK